MNRQKRTGGAKAPVVLGTAQLGLPYGVANQLGQPDESSAQTLLSSAWNLGVRCFDTAQAYGVSERVLGSFLSRRPDVDQARVITKLHPDLDLTQEAAIRAGVEQSLCRLGVSQLWGVLLHREELISSWPGVLGRTLKSMVNEGLVEHLGVSVYRPESARAACETEGMDAIQLPANCMDRRMSRSEIPELASRSGVLLFIRSIFLQGLLVMDPSAVPLHIPRAREAVRCLHAYCRERGICPRRFALDYVRGRWPGTHMVLGAETVSQLAENLHSFQDAPLHGECFDAWDTLWAEDCMPLVNPALWPRA